MIRFLLFILLTLLMLQNSGIADAAVPVSPIQEGSLLTDDAIDQIGDQVMGGNEFRSVRRRVLEQLPDSEKGRNYFYYGQPGGQHRLLSGYRCHPDPHC